MGMIVGPSIAWYRLRRAEYNRELRIAGQLAGLCSDRWEQQTPAWLKWTGDWQICNRISGIDFYSGVNLKEVLPSTEGFSSLRLISIYDQDSDQLDDEAIGRLLELKQMRTLLIYTPRKTWRANDDALVHGYPDPLIQKLQKRLPDVAVVRLFEGNPESEMP